MTKMEIINHALLKTGLPLATSDRDCDYNALYFYDWAVGQCLRSYVWGFAQKFAVLERAEADPPFGFDYAYLLPSDLSRLVDVREQQDLRAPRARCRIVGKYLFTCASPCYFRYISTAVEAEDFPPDFANAVASLLAAEIASLSTQTSALVGPLMQLHERSLARAQAVDGYEQTERVRLDHNIFAEGKGK